MYQSSDHFTYTAITFVESLSMLYKDNDTLCLQVLLLNSTFIKCSIQEVLALRNKTALHSNLATNSQFTGVQYHTNILQ